MSFTKPLSGFRRLYTRYNDTLQAIAARELGDAARWPDIAALNNLRPPYLTTDPAEAVAGVLLAGDEVLVPAPAPLASGVSGNDDLFGRDARLTGGFLTVDDGGDLATVSGDENLRQAIAHRIETRPGELVFHPEYGCEVHSLKGARGDEAANQLGAFYVSRSLRQDPRVAAVENTRATLDGDSVTVTSTVQAIDGKRLPTASTTGTERA